MLILCEVHIKKNNPFHCYHPRNSFQNTSMSWFQRKAFALTKFGFQQGIAVNTRKKNINKNFRYYELCAAQTVALRGGAPFEKALQFLQAWERLSKSVYSLKPIPLLCYPKDHWIELYLVPKKAVCHVQYCIYPKNKSLHEGSFLGLKFQLFQISGFANVYLHAL